MHALRVVLACVSFARRSLPMTDTSRIDERAEALVLAMVDRGIFTVCSVTGAVWRHFEQRKFQRTSDPQGLVPLLQPRRAEYKASNGYLRIKVSVCGMRVDVSAHRVVYRHLVGPIPHGHLIDHEDQCHDNIRPDNLRPVTPSRNLQLAYDRGARVGFARVRSKASGAK
jgi:hypothetical protein